MQLQPNKFLVGDVTEMAELKTKNTLQFEECEVMEDLILTEATLIYAGTFLAVTWGAAAIVALT